MTPIRGSLTHARTPAAAPRQSGVGGSLESGFTLFELVVVIAVGGVLTAWSAQTILLGTRVSQSVTATMRGMDTARDVLSWLERDAAEADAVEISHSAGKSLRLIFARRGTSTIEYHFTGWKLERDDIDLATGIDSLSVELFDRLGSLTSDVESATAVLVTLELEAPAAGVAEQRFLPLGGRTFPYTDMRDSIR